jgi:hypothetical protein
MTMPWLAMTLIASFQCTDDLGSRCTMRGLTCEDLEAGNRGQIIHGLVYLKL